MDTFIKVVPFLTVGMAFTALGILKCYGLWQGIVGGAGKSAICRLAGSCPSWSKGVNIAATLMFCVIGIVNLSVAIIIISTL